MNISAKQKQRMDGLDWKGQLHLREDKMTNELGLGIGCDVDVATFDVKSAHFSSVTFVRSYAAQCNK